MLKDTVVIDSNFSNSTCLLVSVASKRISGQSLKDSSLVPMDAVIIKEKLIDKMNMF